MRRFVKSRVVEWTFAAIMSYWLVYFTMPRENLFLLLAGGIFALWIGILLAYAPAVWKAVREVPPRPMGGQVFVMAVAVMALGFTGIFSWGALYQYLDRPVWMLQNPWRGFFSWVIMVSSVMFLIAGNFGAKADRWTHIGRIAAFGLALSVLLLWLAGGYPSQ